MKVHLNTRGKSDASMSTSKRRRTDPSIAGCSRKRLHVWTDCSGMEAPLWALKFLQVDFTCVQRSEIQEAARIFAEVHHGPATLDTVDMTTDRSDAFRKWGGGRIDLYVCGWPCPSFSVAGQGQGLADSGGQLVAHAIYAIQRLVPKTYLLENVQGLQVKHTSVLESVVRELTGMHGGRYKVDVKTLNSRNHGLPQNRARIFILGVDKHHLQGDAIPWPPPIEPAPLEELLDDLVDKVTPSHMPPATQTTARKNYLTACAEIITTLHRNPLTSNIVADIDGGWGPHWMEGVVPCLTHARCGSQAHWIMNRGRRMNPKEMLRLMGLRDQDVDMTCISRRELGKLIGNSMSVHVLERLFRRLLSVSSLVPLASMPGRWESTEAAIQSARALRG